MRPPGDRPLKRCLHALTSNHSTMVGAGPSPLAAVVNPFRDVPLRSGNDRSGSTCRRHEQEGGGSRQMTPLANSSSTHGPLPNRFAVATPWPRYGHLRETNDQSAAGIDFSALITCCTVAEGGALPSPRAESSSPTDCPLATTPGWHLFREAATAVTLRETRRPTAGRDRQYPKAGTLSH